MAPICQSSLFYTFGLLKDYMICLAGSRSDLIPVQAVQVSVEATGELAAQRYEYRQLKATWLHEDPTDKPLSTASAPPRTCLTAPTVLLRVEDMLRTSLSAGRRRATLIRQAAPSPRAKATIGAMRGAWRVAVVWVLSCMGSEGGATAALHCACLGGE